jgi:4-carboxymuconolactone decarboxylase
MTMPELGPGPLLQPRSSTDTEGDVQRVLGKLETRGTNLTVVRMIANSANAFRPFVLFSDGLMSRSTLPADVREVVILHLAVRLDNSYEWYEHESMSAAAGVTDEQREAVRRGDIAPPLFSEDAVFAVRVADVMLERRGLPQGLWERAITTWGPDAAVDLVLAVGWWGGLVPLALEALGLRDPRLQETK